MIRYVLRFAAVALFALLMAALAMPAAARQTVDTGEWGLEIYQADCVKGEVIPPAVNIGPVEGITFEVTGTITAGAFITIVATLQDEYEFPDPLPDGWELVDDTTAEYAFQLDRIECDVEPTTEPQRDTDDPTVVPTVDPPAAGAGDDVTDLPSTGSGPGDSGHLTMIAFVGIAGAIGLAVDFCRRRA